MKNFFAAFSLVFVLVSCRDRNPEAYSLLHHIPKNTPVIVRVNDLSLLKSELINNDFIKEMKETSFYKEMAGALQITDYLNARGEVLFCFNEIGKQKIEYALITRNRKKLLVTDSLRGRTIDTLTYDGKEIRRIKTKNDEFFITVMDSVFIASSSRLLAENMIRQRNAGERDIDETFYKLYQTANTRKSATVFINNSKVKRLAGVFLESAMAAQLENVADWSAVELSIEPEAIACTGIATAAPSSLKTVRLFHKTVPQKNLTATLTPVNATGFLSFTFDDYTQFRANLTAYQNESSLRTPAAPENDTIFKWVNEIGLIFEKEKTSVAVHTLDMESTKSILTEGVEPVSEFRDISIYPYPDPQLFTTAFSPLIQEVPVAFFACIGDFIWFSESVASLQNGITHYQNKTTLAHHEAYKEFISGLSDEASVMAIGIHPGFSAALQKNMASPYKKDMERIDLKNYPYVAFQMINDRDFAHIAAVVRKTAVKNKDNTVAQAFRVELDAGITVAPQFVMDHRTKQKEIIVQDIENTLYIISGTGKIRWKKKLDGKIRGRVAQVDLYRNGRVQLAFVTPHTFYIIDRDGNEVAPFPLHFTRTITLPLAVFDYERNRDYRFLVCQDKNLGMYDTGGKRVEGFTRTQTRSQVLFTPRHFKIGTKDYLVIAEENGTLHILHRTGETRIDVNRKFDFSENPVFLYKDRFTVTDTSGKLIQIDEKGGMSVRNLKLDREHRIYATNGMLVTLSDNILTIGGKEIMLDFGLYTPPRIFFVNNKIYVAVTDTQSRKVYVYDSNATLLPHFPVYGISAADIEDMDNDGKPEFTVQGDKNAVLLYKTN